MKFEKKLVNFNLFKLRKREHRMVEARSKPVSQDSSRIRFENIFEQIDLNQRKTSIIGTLGPSCADPE